MLYCYNSQQISNIAENSYRTEGTGANAPTAKTSEFSYDANGNLISIHTGNKTTDNKLQATNSRKMLWDEENRLLAVSDNGFVSSYFYDAAGERTVKMSGDGEGVYVNGALSGARTGTTNFTAYISPYMLVRNGGYYTKNVYMESERIVSKLSSSDVFATAPVTTNQQQAKYSMQTAKIKERYDSLGVVYRGTEKTGSLITSDAGKIPTPLSYFYHPDHLGSSSLITDQAGSIVQHLEYVPFGETFIDERNGNWSTPYTFSGKERDEETGLLYVHARYQDSKYGIWYSVDPLAEKYFWTSSYVYCLNNPLKYTDPTGMEVEADAKSQTNIKNTLTEKEAKYVRFDKSGVLDKDKLNKSKSTSENMTALKTLANSEIVYSFEVSNKDHDGNEFFDNTAKGGNYSRGVTELPNAQSNPSPDNKVHIIVGSVLEDKQQVKTTAHEGYGHAYFYELTRDVQKASHTFKSVGSVVWDEELKINTFVSTKVPTNTPLENQINKVVKQAERNYNERKK